MITYKVLKHIIAFVSFWLLKIKHQRRHVVKQTCVSQNIKAELDLIMTWFNSQHLYVVNSFQSNTN